MKLLILSAALSIAALTVGTLLKRTCPEYSILLELAVCVSILTAFITGTEVFDKIKEITKPIMQAGPDYISIILKCCGISIITRFISDICKDSAYNSIAGSIEFAGLLCALGVTLPLIVSVINIIQSLI